VQLDAARGRLFTNMKARKLGLNALIYGLGGMLNRMISFLLLPLFTHFLTPEDYGRAGMLQILSLLLSSVFSVGIGGSLSSCYFREESEGGKRQAVFSAVLLLLASSAVLLVGLLPFSGGLADWLLEGREWTSLVVYTLISSVCGIVVLPFVYSLQFAGQSRRFVALSAVSTVISALLNVCAVAWMQTGLAGWVFSQMLGQAIAVLLYAAPFLRGGLTGGRRDLVKRLLLLGLPMVPCFACMYVMQQGNRYAVEWVHGLGQLGIYNVAISLATVSSLAVSAFQTSWTPYFMSYRNQPEEARTAFGRMTTYYVYFMGLVTVCFFAFAQPVVEIMTGSGFHAAWRGVGLLALASVLVGATNLLTPAQYFSGRLAHLTVMQTVAAVCSIGINLLFVLSSASLESAAAALVVTYLLLLGIHYFWNRRGYSMELPVDYEWGRLLGTAAAVAAVAVFTLVCPAPTLAAASGKNFNVLLMVFVRSSAIVAVFALWLWAIMDSGTRSQCRQLLGRIIQRRSRSAA
jgi:O-antigen/teichoic acid export membrane protein